MNVSVNNVRKISKTQDGWAFAQANGQELAVKGRAGNRLFMRTLLGDVRAYNANLREAAEIRDKLMPLMLMEGGDVRIAGRALDAKKNENHKLKKQMKEKYRVTREYASGIFSNRDANANYAVCGGVLAFGAPFASFLTSDVFGTTAWMGKVEAATGIGRAMRNLFTLGQPENIGKLADGTMLMLAGGTVFLATFVGAIAFKIRNNAMHSRAEKFFESIEVKNFEIERAKVWIETEYREQLNQIGKAKA